jgi:hypothetical protein
VEIEVLAEIEGSDQKSEENKQNEPGLDEGLAFLA